MKDEAPQASRSVASSVACGHCGASKLFVPPSGGKTGSTVMTCDACHERFVIDWAIVLQVESHPIVRKK
jgi:hypothetical protein